MLISSNPKEEATLYYLYMMADGKVTDSEEKLFIEICKELQVDFEEIHAIIIKCNELLVKNFGEREVIDIIVNEKIDEQVEYDRLSYGAKDASSHARIVWNLVNLGYADTFYSHEEKKIVQYLVDKWSINSDIYQEIIDTADTILALTKQKEWIVSTFPNGSIRNEKEKKIDSEIKQFLDDIKLTIQEITM